MPATTKEGLTQARTRVKEAYDLLLRPTPEALDGCAVRLKEAATIVSSARLGLAGSPEQTKAALVEAYQLKEAIRRARLLLDTALEFHLNWSRRVRAIMGGYTSEGEPAPANLASRLVVKA